MKMKMKFKQHNKLTIIDKFENHTTVDFDNNVFVLRGSIIFTGVKDLKSFTKNLKKFIKTNS